MLRVVARDQRYWMFRYRHGDKERTMSLGNADLITLDEARKRHRAAHMLLDQGTDPRAERQPKATFSHAAAAYIAAHSAGWHGRTEAHWRQSLADHVSFGDKPVADVTVDDVLSCLTPIWASKTVTASLVRNRIELVLDYAKGRGWRMGENPAAWRGNLRSLLPRPGKVHVVDHRAALDWREAPSLLASLPLDGSVAERCLRFLVLTAVRSGEARGSRWDEIDMANAVWTIPASRMKAGREHRVPLSDAAMAILHDLALLRTGDLVFFGRQHGRPLSDVTLTRQLCRLGHDNITVHGMRSMFAQWCQDTGKPSDVCEAALAHQTGNAVRRAYARSDVLDLRRRLMDQWADYLTQPPAVVVPLRVTG
jgi:integrase